MTNLLKPKDISFLPHQHNYNRYVHKYKGIETAITLDATYWSMRSPKSPRLGFFENRMLLWEVLGMNTVMPRMKQ